MLSFISNFLQFIFAFLILIMSFTCCFLFVFTSVHLFLIQHLLLLHDQCSFLFFIFVLSTRPNKVISLIFDFFILVFSISFLYFYTSVYYLILFWSLLISLSILSVFQVSFLICNNCSSNLLPTFNTFSSFFTCKFSIFNIFLVCYLFALHLP